MAAVESAYSQRDGKQTVLSDQSVVDCDRTNGGCNGGLSYKAMAHIVKNGVHLEEDYPYVAR